ncbi:hypothetical protein P175DRAFT_0505701 [Aspergillus ochraceoroseus IBT 24754]|uniref:SWI5-dependent HO expression protein 3 n=3 Tax=Aspergillus subgen. Nidulantes TaxID=2720870 RepID=A0A0F8V258_9EURO|nr:uncharacterized protein P175DRAFT_0505701 [Aspergillus ochraceoroseus IBT 24754]KKK17300.1 hypothetical protein AOCH_001796 [Aspergillus ochraceoroseus]KKK25828.1 hypothetical protein ARAM_000489 [Aspergillus rambellii]PTU23938.1 hypothetical protein P175DRAFT_0505701 [Aspergillus ochraceoroseus IBT 24754]
MPSIVRFGRAKKPPKPEIKNTNDDAHGSPTSDTFQPPRVNLVHVETDLNMHQYNGLFELDSPERQKLSSAVESSADTMTLSSSPTNGSSHPPNGEPTAEWSSAVGHAATGKSGRVIHNLQEEIARLTRECTLYRSRAEETQRMNDAYKTQVQNMADRLRNLEHSNEMNLHSLARKDKKIEELRAEIQNEKDRRGQAENETKKFHKLMDEAQDEFHRKCAELHEISHHSRTQYDVLAKSTQRERTDQERRLKNIRDEFTALKEKHEETNSHLEHLDSIMAEKDREIEAAKENFENLFTKYETYRKTHDEEVRSLIDQSQQGEDRFNAALASLKETEGQMKWIMQVKREVKSAE